jgi:hypothetical protein
MALSPRGSIADLRLHRKGCLATAIRAVGSRGRSVVPVVSVLGGRQDDEQGSEGQ